MKWITYSLFLFLFTGFVYSQQPETRQLKPFSKLSVEDRIVAILQSDSVSNVLLDPKGDAWNEEIKTNVNGSELHIKSAGRYRDAVILCYVRYDQPIVTLIARYGGVIRTDSNEVLKSKKLEIIAKIDGFANLDVSLDELIIEAGSGSDIHVRGRASKVTILASSGAKVHLDDLDCDDAVVSCSMGAKVWLTAKNNYSATAGTGGKIYYYSEPAGKFERHRITGGNVELVPR